MLPLTEHFRRELLDRAIAREESGCTLGSNPRDAGIAIGCITNQRKIVGYQLGIYPKLRSDAVCISNDFGPSVDLYDALLAHALREILIRSPNANFLYAGVQRGACSCRC